ncbi:MAG: HepT-like ribonuclease domain-containing protein, partial [Waterburya sp.]
ATLFRLQTIGEAANQLPEEMKAQYPEIPWRDIIDFRNLLAHRYWRIDINVVWAILEPNGELTDLKTVVKKLIKNIDTTSG